MTGQVLGLLARSLLMLMPVNNDLTEYDGDLGQALNGRQRVKALGEAFSRFEKQVKDSFGGTDHSHCRVVERAL